MTRHLVRHLALVAALVIGAVVPAPGSQIANHLRLAHLAWESPATPPAIKEVLLRHFDAYLAGAAGPDVFTNLVGQYDELLHTPHYHRTGQLIRNMLEIAYAQQNPIARERYLAYTLGWITHYHLDIYEHKLVNRYGGYFKIDGKRHKALEMFETAHVFAVSEHADTLPYVPRAGALPVDLVVDALYRTFPRSLVDRLFENSNIQDVRDAGLQDDVRLAANVMEQFMLIGIDAYRTQGRVGTAQEAAMGQIPFRTEYEALLAPLNLAITRFVIDPRTQPGDQRSIFAELTWSLRDEGLTVAYISDWYQSNADALRACVATFQSVNGSLWRVPLTLPDYDLDTGDPEGDDSAAVSASEAFRRVEAVEIAWQIANPRGQALVQGTEVLYVGSSEVDFETPYARARTGKGRIIYIPAEPELFFVENQKLTLTATLRMINNNRQLMSGRYVSAFDFAVGQPSSVLKREKVVLEASDQWRSVVDMPQLTEGPTETASPCGESEARVRRALDGLRGPIDGSAAALDAVRSLRAAAAAASGQAATMLTQLQSLSATLGPVEAECAQAGRATADLVSRLDWTMSQARIRDEKAGYLAALACQLAEQAMNASDPGQAAQHLRGAEGFARETAKTAADADALAADASRVAEAATALLATIAGTEQRLADARGALDALRARRERLAGELEGLVEWARQAGGPLEAAVADIAALSADMERSMGSCPERVKVADEIALAQQRLLGLRNLVTGESEAVAAEVAAARGTLQQAASTIAEIEGRLGACALGDARGAAAAASGRAAEVAALAGSARASATKAAECASIALGTTPPRGEPTVSGGSAGTAEVDTSGVSRTPPGDPSGEAPGGNPWDEAAGVRPFPPGGNPWDEAVRGRDRGATGSTSASPSTGTSGAAAPRGIDDLLASAAALADPPSCRYEAAAAALAQARALAPADPRVAVMEARLLGLMGARAAALASYQHAQGQLAANDVAGALASARVARGIGPPCDRARADDLIALIENSLARGQVAEDRQRAADRSRAQAAAILGTLIDIYNTGTAEGGAGDVPLPPGSPAGGSSARPAPDGRALPLCTIQHASAEDEPGVYWAVIAVPATAQVTNYLVMPFRQDGVGPEEWASTAAQLGGGRPEIRGRGSRSEMDGLAGRLCPNPAVAPGGMGVPQR